MKRNVFLKIALVIILFFTAREGYAATTNFNYNGKIITVDSRDLILTTDGVLLDNPEKYADQIGETEAQAQHNDEEMEDSLEEYNTYSNQPVSTTQKEGITKRQYEEEQRAQKWLDIVEDLEVREVDKKALDLVKEFHSATNAVPPSLGQTGAVVFAYQTYIPKVICRPMYVTDIILEPGELVNGVHPGDSARWTFVPGEVGEGSSKQISVLVKPLMPDISTNLIITTTKRRYNLYLLSSSKDYMPSVSFTYPTDRMNEWDNFIRTKREESKNATTVAEGYSIRPEDLHLNYKIEGSDSIRWKPVLIYDDGVKTYIKFKNKSSIKSVETPVFVVFEKKKEIVVNYRFVSKDMMVIDKVFDVGALIVGTGSIQQRVTLRRLR